MIFSDAIGNPVTGDRVLALAALALKRQGLLRGEAMACTVMSNLGLHEAMKGAGIRVIVTPVGDRNVIEALRREDCSFGGENSGHLIFSDHATTGDGILSALQVLKVMKERGATLAELASCMTEFPQEVASLRVNSKPPLAELDTLQDLMHEATRTFGEAGRHLIRYSGTENKIRILVEHRDTETVHDWIGRFTQTVAEEIGIPA